jgi:hypothetical protein
MLYMYYICYICYLCYICHICHIYYSTIIRYGYYIGIYTVNINMYIEMTF